MEQHKSLEEKIHKCDKCKSCFSKPYLLVNHVQLRHGNTVKDIECSDCEKL
jgi:hypothetical protein